MNFIKRLTKYLIGFLIGSLLVYFMLIRGRDRDIKGWFPADRVVQEIREQELVIHEHASCQLHCLEISEKDLDKLIKNAGVNFGKSRVRNEPCPVYLLESRLKDRTVSFEIEKCKNSSVLRKVFQVEITCNCS